jgi:hypothetical protein
VGEREKMKGQAHPVDLGEVVGRKQMAYGDSDWIHELQELHNLYSSPDIIRQIKSRRMRWAGHVARTGEGRNVYRVFGGKARGKKTTSKTKA